MNKKVYITRDIPDEGPRTLMKAGFELTISEKDGVLTKRELVEALAEKPYDGVLCLLTDAIDKDVFDSAPTAKIFANYAVGFNNVNLADARERGVTITNTPDVLTDTVAEHTVALMLAATSRIAEGDRYVREEKFTGWAPKLLLGADLKGKTLGLLGAGRIGTRVAQIASRGLLMKVLYYDVKRNESLEKETGAEFIAEPEALLSASDIVTIHVPLLPETRHFMDERRLSLMKRGAYLINTSRGPVIDERALVNALAAGVIAGAALDVYENEPELAPGLSVLQNVVLTPHIASATTEARQAMSRVAAENLIAYFEGRTPPNIVA